METNGYRIFDQDEKLGEPPWSGESLAAWESAHGHDARLKCYPEFGCQVLERAQEQLEEAAQAVVKAAMTWLAETSPGMHINTAKGRGETRRAVDRLVEALGALNAR